MKLLTHFAVVLAHPRYPGNIGLVARAMKNTGLRNLRLIAPPQGWRKAALLWATHAEDIVRKARVFRMLRAAVADMVFVAGTTRRGGEERSPVIFNDDAVARLGKRARGGPVAIVFGNERVGLSEAELGYCHENYYIPTSSDHPSLNLSHAVLLVTHALFLRYGADHARIVQKDATRYFVSEAELEKLCSFLKPALCKLGYQNTARFRSLDKILTGIKRTARKASFEVRETQLLKGLARRVLDLEISGRKKPHGNHLV